MYMDKSAHLETLFKPSHSCEGLESRRYHLLRLDSAGSFDEAYFEVWALSQGGIRTANSTDYKATYKFN